MTDWNPERDNVGAPRRKVACRTIAEAERGEIRALLSEHQVDEDAITELLDAAELYGEVTSIRWGVWLVLTPDDWGADTFAAVDPGESADGGRAA